MENVHTKANSQIYLSSDTDRAPNTEHLPMHLGELMKSLESKKDPTSPGNTEHPEMKLKKLTASKPYGELLNSFRPKPKPYFMTPYVVEKGAQRPFLNSERKKLMYENFQAS